jgi:hypothetical protein
MSIAVHFHRGGEMQKDISGACLFGFFVAIGVTGINEQPVWVTVAVFAIAAPIFIWGFVRERALPDLPYSGAEG